MVFQSDFTNLHFAVWRFELCCILISTWSCRTLLLLPTWGAEWYLSSRRRCTTCRYLGRGGGGGPPTPWWIAEVTRVPTTRNGNPNTLTHRIVVLESPRKIQRSQAWMECFYSQRKQQTKISSNSVCWFPVAGGPLSSQYRAIGLHASGPLVPQPVCVSRSVVSDSLRPHEL